MDACAILASHMSKRLKMDLSDRPLMITSDGHIFVESFSEMYDQMHTFLIAIAESAIGSELVHEYKLTPSSLYGAAVADLQSQEIIQILEKFNQTNLSESVIQLIESNILNYGKVQLILEHNRYFIQSTYSDAILTLLQDPQIAECRLGEIDRSNEKMFSCQIQQTKIELLRKRCRQLGYPLLEEYDYLQDKTLPNLNIQLRSSTLLRNYQEKSLQKMFDHNLARSGLIILPCGAGKSVVGVSAACNIKKNCFVLCNSNVSVQQWKDQFQMWSTADDSLIRLFTSEKKQKPTNSCIFISTYQMISYNGQFNADTIEIMKLIKDQEWGLLILDEVHTIPADSFRKILTNLRAHVKLGLTATLVREDEKIDDLNFLIGPKLYEANWIELQNSGYIARVHCAEVRCPMSEIFYQKYLSLADAPQLRQCLCAMNPNKYHACEYLIRYHEKRNDKIIVSSDDIFALKFYAKKLLKPYIYGDLSQAERMNILENFRQNPKISTIFISRVGDTSFDLPDANVLIQISSHGRSRRHEAQRLGRILRSKTGDNNAYFYSIISQDTLEMDYSEKRQSFLIDQGYTYEIITNLDGQSSSTRQDEEDFIQQIQKENLFN